MMTTPRQAAVARHSDSLSAWTWRMHVVCSRDPRKVGRVLHLRVNDHAWLIGRGQQDDLPGLRFDDGLMSREHVRLSVPPGPSVHVGVEDLASTNGTFLNGAQVVRAEASAGAVLRFGDTVTVLEVDAGRAAGFDDPWPEVPGASEAARRLRAQIAAVAPLPMPALVVGETGVGKEHIATALHRLSRREGPLVRVNIAAVPETLFEAELFGAVAGAFTGAIRSRRGLVAEADGGTLVLDEVGELPMSLQVKLLRVLEDGRVRPLGGSVDQQVDVRFLASTNADLDALCHAGRFRADLLARLRGQLVLVPPLRERRPDLLDLADAIEPLVTASGAKRRWCMAADADVVEALLLRPWPFNLRDLRRALVELRSLLGDEGALLRWLDGARGQAGGGPAGEPPTPTRRRTSSVKAISPVAALAAGDSRDPRWPPRRRRAPSPEGLRQLLRGHRGNVEAMARELGCARRQVYRWIEAAGITAQDIAAARDEAP